MTEIHAAITSDAYAPQNLVHGNSHLLLSQQVTIAAGQTLTPGAILGKGGTKHYLASANDLAGDPIADGRNAPLGILAHDVDASTADQPAMMYTRGDFIESACAADASLDTATVKAALKALNIYLIAAE
ncbi:MAG: head decoration protein [Chromatiaceae bacterium]|nr:head decoration protein [Chromatiaceae bacterium]MCF7994678.1 head decoration protein [Chromatiaceae bacterium]MCF8004788.1 head decoration protein [Chromatiaceae bacterium]